MCRLSHREPEQGPALALGVLLAGTVMLFRVVLLVGLIAPALARDVAALVGTLGQLALAIVLIRLGRRSSSERANLAAGANPTAALVGPGIAIARLL